MHTMFGTGIPNSSANAIYSHFASQQQSMHATTTPTTSKSYQE